MYQEMIITDDIKIESLIPNQGSMNVREISPFQLSEYMRVTPHRNYISYIPIERMLAEEMEYYHRILSPKVGDTPKFLDYEINAIILVGIVDAKLRIYLLRWT